MEMKKEIIDYGKTKFKENQILFHKLLLLYKVLM